MPEDDIASAWGGSEPEDIECPTAEPSEPSVPRAALALAPLVPDVVPRALAVRPKPRARSGHQHIDVTGGWLVSTGQSLDAHCNLCAHDGPLECKVDRTCVPKRLSPGSLRGRPLGFLLAWLLYGKEHADRASHKRAADLSKLDDADKHALRYEVRARLREWAKLQPWYGLIKEHEKLDPAEPDEPFISQIDGDAG